MIPGMCLFYLKVFYSRSANLFSLDTMSGEILLAKPLDRETLAHHVLKLTAYERLDPQVSASATVIVDVLDVQDNSPQFERNVYFGEIKENASVSGACFSCISGKLLARHDSFECVCQRPGCRVEWRDHLFAEESRRCIKFVHNKSIFRSHSNKRKAGSGDSRFC